MLTEDYCSYELAKLLKEKEFDGLCRRYDFEDWQGRHTDTSTILPSNFNKHGGNTSIPTLQMAMKWLREEYDLHIIAYPYNANGKKKWCCQVYKAFNLLGNEKYVNETLDSYEQAVEAALKYCLTELI